MQSRLIAEFSSQNSRSQGTIIMLKWKVTTAALGVALTIAVFMLQAKSSSLTALDYIEIEQLANRYGQTIDTCSNNGYDYADLYTPDGVFIDKFSPDGFQKGGVILAQGREKLAEVVGGGRSAASGQ